MLRVVAAVLDDEEQHLDDEGEDDADQAAQRPLGKGEKLREIARGLRNTPQPLTDSHVVRYPRLLLIHTGINKIY